MHACTRARPRASPAQSQHMTRPHRGATPTELGPAAGARARRRGTRAPRTRARALAAALPPLAQGKSFSRGGPTSHHTPACCSKKTSPPCLPRIRSDVVPPDNDRRVLDLAIAHSLAVDLVDSLQLLVQVVALPLASLDLLTYLLTASLAVRLSVS